MFWKHLKEKLRDPATWADLSVGLIKDAIKWAFRGAFLLLLGIWLGSKINPDAAKAWRASPAPSACRQALWTPLGVPRLIVAITLVFAVLVPAVRWCRAWWQRRKPRTIVVKFVEPAPRPKPLMLDDLNEGQRRLLTMLIRLYPSATELRHVSEVFKIQYSVAERLCESLEKLNLRPSS